QRMRPLGWCLSQMHLPDNEEAQFEARRRLVIEEFLYLQLALQMRRNAVQQETGISFPISRIHGAGDNTSNLFGEVDAEKVEGNIWDQVRSILPFELTGAQHRVIEEIWHDMEQPGPMNRLVQGDVGSGKTAVAAAAMLGAVRSGY